MRDIFITRWFPALIRGFLVLALLAGILEAGNTGKIAGHITDRETGATLIGVNVIVLNTVLGASTDGNGDYFIINIPPGTYTVKVMLIGYETITMADIHVSSDRTTTVDVRLKKTVLQGQEVTVTAPKPIIEINSTSTSTSLDGKDIEYLPVANVDDLLKTVGGVVSQNGELHVRGGRSNEVSYMIDGVMFNDPMSGKSGQFVSTGAIEELVVVTGTYNAEYGNAMSGIVNVVTKSGSNDHKGRLRLTTGASGNIDGSKFPYDIRKITADGPDDVAYVNSEPYTDLDSNRVWDSGEPFLDWNHNGSWDSDTSQYNAMVDQLHKKFGDYRRFELTLWGPILRDRLYYSLSAEGLDDPGYLPFAYNNLSNLGGKSPVGSLFTKLTWQSRRGLKLNASYHQSNRQWREYNHFFKYLPARQAHMTEASTQATVSFSYQFSPRTFAEGSWSLFRNQFFAGANRRWVFDEIEGPYFGGPEVFAAYYDDPEEFAVEGYDSRWEDSRTRRFITKGSITSQLNKFNMVKAGFSHIINQLKRESHDSMEDYDWIDQLYEYNPLEVSAYVQDKVEFESVILNVGLRLDYFDPRADFWPDPRYAGIADSAEAASPKWQLSPRLGFSHPITTRAVLHFAYGHFLQIPDYELLYWNLSNVKIAAGDSSVYVYQPEQIDRHNPTLGNPDLEPQKTVVIEIGWQQQVGKSMRVDLTTFYKDIENLVSTRLIPATPTPFTRYINTDYANVRGIELSLDNRFNENLSASISYTMSRAEGNSSDVFEAFYDVFATPPKVLPKRVVTLDWDQLHTLNLVVDVNTGNLRNILTRDWNLSLIANYGSGLPYTAENTQGLRVGEINGERLPPSFNMDLYLTKTLPLKMMENARVFLEVSNLFNTLTVLEVHRTTGLPDYSLFPEMTYDGINNPGFYGPPRQIRLGVDLAW